MGFMEQTTYDFEAYEVRNPMIETVHKSKVERVRCGQLKEQV